MILMFELQHRNNINKLVCSSNFTNISVVDVYLESKNVIVLRVLVYNPCVRWQPRKCQTSDVHPKRRNCANMLFENNILKRFI